MPYRTLMRKSRGEDVRLLQKQLELIGLKPGPVDGVYGFLTERAVMSFQKSRGLPVDGIAGPRTWSALLSRQEPEQVVEINLMPITRYGGRGKAIIDIAREQIKVTCRAMPFLSTLAGESAPEEPCRNFSLWLALPEQNKLTKVGIFASDGLEYKIEVDKVKNIRGYNLLLVMADNGDGNLAGLPLLIGSY